MKLGFVEIKKLAKKAIVHFNISEVHFDDPFKRRK